MTAETTSVPNIVQTTAFAQKMSIFLIPRRIVKNDLLRVLSGDALAMYLLIAFKLYRKVTQELLMSDFEITVSLGIPEDLVRATRIELAAHHLIEYKLVSVGCLYRFSADDHVELVA